MSSSHTFQSFDTTPFSFLKWENAESPEKVIICVHGFCGAANDFEGFARDLLEQVPDFAIYAYNLRGMGFDPVENRRGDIESADYWLKDLEHFTKHVKNLHPDATVFWCGESLGAMIATHTAARAELCDGLILLSPVVRIGTQIASWKIKLAQWACRLFPAARVRLRTFTGSKKVQVTQGAEDHEGQSQTNAWHIDNFSLRLLNGILSLIIAMPKKARDIHEPTLLLYGGKDFFTPTDAIENWMHHFPSETQVKSVVFPEAYHLLLYDQHSPTIFAHAAEWIQNFPIASSKKSRHV